MLSVLDPLRQFTFATVLLRLLLAAFCGGAVGYGRSQMARPAGLRTYMLTCTGAALAVLLTLYDYEMLHGAWQYALDAVGEKFDASRLASQAITGIGFLGAGI
ncbi:MAG: MgtC/SapB family protein, partial [Clostridia bacterium]|nr:MgtC/SapB family protein [Clostridia bacterium]